MDDDGNATCLDLMIAEKQQQQRPSKRKPSGCAGIFYQLFDWNTRLAKTKKLFPSSKSKLLSSGHGSSKRFSSHDKLPAPKFQLIADENRGGFPNANRNNGGNRMDIVQHKHEMKAPSLVAKLMGLDSMPTAAKQKPVKAFHSHTYTPHKKDDKLPDDREDIVLERGQLSQGRTQPRPQKLQKTGQFAGGSQAVTRLGADALQLKNVLLACSGKHLRGHKGGHHPKLPTPVKSPRARSARNGSRLIDAATRILEPGLRGANKANSISYSRFTHDVLKHLDTRAGMIVQPDDSSAHSNFHPNGTDTFVVRSPCKSCSIPNGDFAFQSVEAGQNLHFNSNISRQDNPHKLDTINFTPCRISTKQEYGNVLQLDSDQPDFAVSRSQKCAPIHQEIINEKRPLERDGQMEWYFSSRLLGSKMRAQSSNALNFQGQTINRIPSDKEKLKPKFRIDSFKNRRTESAVKGINEVKNMGGLNRNVSCQTRPNMPSKVVRLNKEMEKGGLAFHNKGPVQKQRIPTSNGKRDHIAPPFGKPGIRRSDRCSPKCSPKSLSNAKSKFGQQGTGKNEESSSFPFQSPARFITKISMSKESKEKSEETPIMNGDNLHISSREPFPAEGDVLSALLEQKLKELTSQEEVLTSGRGQSQRTMSMILQELISALKSEQPALGNALGTVISGKDEVYNELDISSHELNACQLHSDSVQAEMTRMRLEHLSAEYSGDADHLSPGSVLGVSFSSSSCVSSCQDDFPELTMPHGSMGYSHHYSSPSGPGTCLKHVAPSNQGLNLTLTLIRYISTMLDELRQRGTTFTANKLSHVKDVILHAGLLLENGAQWNSKGGNQDLMICRFFNQLELLANPGVRQAKRPTQLTGILFDLAIEYLESNFGDQSTYEVNLQTRLPLWPTAQQLILGLKFKFRQWEDLAGKTPDELIEWELVHSSEKWTNHKIEACEAYREIDEHLLKSLVEEVVVDICEINLVSETKLS